MDTEKFFGATKADFEKKLRRIADIELVELKSLDDPNFHPCDLLIMTANLVPEDHFFDWVTKLKKKIRSQAKIWSPALILSDVEFSVQNEMFKYAVHENWYFDIVHSQQLDSIPIRVANLLRIHDHMHELRRYNDLLSDFGRRINSLESKLTGDDP